MDFPASITRNPPIITPFSPWASNVPLNISWSMTLATSGAWQSANQALYYPFQLTDHATLYQFLWFVGGTATGNVDLGVYDAQNHLIVSTGSTALSGTNAVQQFNVTDTALAPGSYLLAGVASTTSATIFRISAGADELILPLGPIYQEASALPLPATATPVLTTETTTIIPAFGIQLRSVF